MAVLVRTVTTTFQQVVLRVVVVQRYEIVFYSRGKDEVIYTTRTQVDCIDISELIPMKRLAS